MRRPERNGIHIAGFLPGAMTGALGTWLEFPALILSCILLLAPQFVQAQTSPHGKLDIPCQDCHSTNSWQMAHDATFDHSKTGFPLTGQHASTTCYSCHQKPKFEGLTPACSTCHPDVHKSELGAACGRCHDTQSWKITDMIQRHQLTRFPLVGRHTTLDCESCHTSASTYQYTGTSLTCYGCHRNDFLQATNPNHQLGNFSVNCESCHAINALAWGSGFDHSRTAFPLTGAHIAVQCLTCHTNSNFQLKYVDCYQCHSSDFKSASNPNHLTGNFGQICQTCHSTTVWQPATFNHGTTKFPLTGAHLATPCQGCHTNGNYQLVYSNCYQCHATDFTSATNPNHVTGNFSQICQSCHSTTVWQPATFDHGTTKFPLTGAHLATPCQGCHTNGNYQLVYSNCYQCHASDFTAATNPNHVTGNFSQICQTCHSTSVWQPATFDHNTTKFKLTGAHVSVQCQGCHTNGNYQLLYNGCYSCHTSEFQTTTNPNHIAAHYPTTCETCHSTTAWTGATFNHIWFPMTHGRANSVCSNCHTNATDYSVFQCTDCHTAGTTNSRHSRVSGYVFNSTNCYSCHPRG